MNIDKEIKRNELRIETLYLLSSLENKLKATQDSIKGLGGTFPNLVGNWKSDEEITRKSIIRVKERYRKI
jgi:hypothetical protein